MVTPRCCGAPGRWRKRTAARTFVQTWDYRRNLFRKEGLRPYCQKARTPEIIGNRPTSTLARSTYRTVRGSLFSPREDEREELTG